MKRFLYLPLIFAAACGDDVVNTKPDAAVQPDTAMPDTPQPLWTPPASFAMPLAAAGPDQLMSLVAGPSGSFYAAGFAAQTLSGAKMIVVAKLTASGTLDTTWAGGDGVYTSELEFKGGTDEIDIVTQSDGKIVVSATVAATLDAADRDIALFRLNTDGTLDTTFGTLGVTTLSLNTSTTNSSNMVVGMDAARSLAVGPSDALFVHALSRAEGTTGDNMPRTDTDFTVVKLSASGTHDLTYAGDGKFTLDIQEANATARGLRVLADGSVIASGYATTPGLGTGVHPVLYRLTPAGSLDTGFATNGFFHEVIFAKQTEIYHFAIEGENITTAGYGSEAGPPHDWISLRFNATTGARDMTFGGATNGAVVIDPSGTHLGSNCRNAIALPGGRTALIGSTGPSNMPEQDAAFAIIKQNGQLDEEYGTGVHKLKLSTTADGNDQFWGAAVSDGKLMLVGWKGGGSAQTETVNDDAAGLVFELK